VFFAGLLLLVTGRFRGETAFFVGEGKLLVVGSK
jgi:hypothetical protein